MTRPKSKEHMVWYIGTHELLCLHCGYKFPLNPMLPASITMVVEMHKAFDRSHRNCYPSSSGNELREWMDRHWETVKPAAENS